MLGDLFVLFLEIEVGFRTYFCCLGASVDGHWCVCQQFCVVPAFLFHTG